MRPVQLVRYPRVTLQDEVNAPETAIKVASVQLAAPGQLEWTRGAGSCHQIGFLLPVWLDVNGFDACCVRVHVQERAPRSAGQRGCVHKIFLVISARFVSHQPTQRFR